MVGLFLNIVIIVFAIIQLIMIIKFFEIANNVNNINKNLELLINGKENKNTDTTENEKKKESYEHNKLETPKFTWQSGVALIIILIIIGCYLIFS